MDYVKINKEFNLVRAEMSKNSVFNPKAVGKETARRLIDTTTCVTESEFKAVYDLVMSNMRGRK